VIQDSSKTLVSLVDIPQPSACFSRPANWLPGMARGGGVADQPCTTGPASQMPMERPVTCRPQDIAAVSSYSINYGGGSSRLSFTGEWRDSDGHLFIGSLASSLIVRLPPGWPFVPRANRCSPGRCSARPLDLRRSLHPAKHCRSWGLDSAPGPCWPVNF